MKWNGSSLKVHWVYYIVLNQYVLFQLTLHQYQVSPHVLSLSFIFV